MTWYYKIIRHDAPKAIESYSKTWFGVHEYYELDDHLNWTEDPVAVTGDSAQECIDQLNMMLADCEAQILSEKRVDRVKFKRPWWAQVWKLFVSKSGGQ